MTAVGLTAAIAIPTMAFGAAHRNSPASDVNFLKTEQTPYLASLAGVNELGGGDPDGAGTAAITFQIDNPASNVDGATVCWDLAYSNLTGTPTGAHIHRGAAGIGGNIVVPFTGATFTTSGSSGCAPIGGPQTGETVGGGVLATEIVNNPAGFYVNVHTTDFTAGAIRGQLAAGPAPAGEAHLLPLPLRAYDSRDNAGPKIQPGDTRTISLASGKDRNNVSFIAVPPGATAAIITLTVAETDFPGGFLTIYPANVSQPATSNINWKGAAGQDIAVGTQVAVDSSGMVKVTDGIGGSATHFIIDVIEIGRASCRERV